MKSSEPSMMRIADRSIGGSQPTFVIAEAGVNHDGSVDKAHQLIAAAADAGADAVKFQTFDPKALVTRDAPAAQYQRESAGATDQYSMLDDLTLPTSAWSELAAHAEARGLVFMSTPFDPESLRLLVGIGVPAIKVSSGDVTNFVLLRAIAATGLPAILSTGASTFDEVERALRVLASGSPTAVLHCVTAYPAPLGASNLRAMAELGRRLDVIVGWSDHTTGTESALMAVAMNAKIIEKHLTLDVGGQGPDHRASVDADGLASYIEFIREAEAALGDGVKQPTQVEFENRQVVRRSLHAGRDLQAGTVLEAADLVALRPGTGLAADTDYEGRTIARSMTAGEPLRSDDLVEPVRSEV